MYGLDVESLLIAQTIEQSFDIWHPPNKNKNEKKGKKQTIVSESADDVSAGVKAYKKGASLYFSSGVEFRNGFCKALCAQLGYDFGGYFPGTTTETSAGDTSGEIEIFLSRKGNYTDFHIDFQQNFTLQLKGSKTWRLLVEPGMEDNVRGFTAHYDHSDCVGHLESQAKTHSAFNKVDIGKAYDKKRLIKESTTVVLNEGDFLYHPAGIWHSVESTEDSVSINFSLRQLRVADLIGNALKMHMLRQPELRQGISIAGGEEQFRSTIQSGLKSASKYLAGLKPESLVPYSMHVPRILTVDLDAAPEEQRTKVQVGQSLVVSTLFILTDLLQLPQSGKKKPKEVARYAVNGLFGSEEFESICRVTLSTKKATTKTFFDKVIKSQHSEGR